MVLEAALLGWALGVAVQLQQAQLWSPAGYATWVLGSALLWAGVLACRRLVPRGLTFLLSVLLVACLAFACTGWRAGIQYKQALSPELEGVNLLMTGVVSHLPQSHEQGVRFRLRVEQASRDGQTVTVPEFVNLGWWVDSRKAPDSSDAPEGVPLVRAGDRWRVMVRLKTPHGQMNPHGFDYELWLWEQGVGATGAVRTGRMDALPTWLGDSGLHRVTRWRQRVRDAIVGGEGDAQMARARGVVAALVVGDQAAIERSDWDVFRVTGVAHLMSISGLHITMFAWLAVRLVRRAWALSGRLCLACPAPVAARVSGLLMATAYAVFSGWGVPAQRTIWMLAVVTVLHLMARRWPWPLVWLMALTVVLVMDPWALLQAGFWLSFVAVGVLMATDSRQTDAGVTLAAPPVQTWGQRVWHGLRLGWKEQCLISLSLAPLSLLFFNQVSVVGLLANAIAIPWVTLVVTPLAMLGTAWPLAWDWAAQAVLVLVACLQALGQLPFASISLPAAPLVVSVLAVVGGFVLVLRLPGSLRVLALPLLAPLLLFAPNKPGAGQFDLLAMDVGQGTAVLVRTAGHSLLYDTGPRYGVDSDAGHRVVVPLLRALGERLNVLMISHQDIDHAGGAPAVLKMQAQVRVSSSMPAPTDAHQWTRCEAGQAWQWDGVRFEVLHPHASDYSDNLPSNAMSCVLKITGQDRSALLTGDIERAQEARLVLDETSRQRLRADILLVPHHGSKTSSTPDFIAAVQPQVAIVQAGYRSRFGHPASSVMQRYAQAGVRVVRTDRCGAWWGGSDSLQDAPNQCERGVSRRYWHHVLRDDEGSTLAN